MKTLAEQMSFYAAYHNDETNKAIHYLFVPLIVWSSMGLLIQLGTWEMGGLGFTVAHGVALLLLGYYLRLDLGFGVAMAVLFTFLLVTALQVSDASRGPILGLPGAAAVWFFLAIFVMSWAAQLVGHRFFEGRKPALADDLFQVFVAPVFVMAEWGFALGLRKELRAEVHRRMMEHLPKPSVPGTR
jgi:uncharacterized membrane protein YGL010W